MKFTRAQLVMVKLVPYTRDIIIGLLLSDGSLAFSNSRSKNARLGFHQSAAHGEYCLFLLFSLSHYCSSYPI
jgi:hypothetical protein